ncbi:MAG TPA: 6-pyruvoyl-tetrahydropterin synthase-related protein [Terriglobales bacterium]|nr:6-pyruvoyl-tetrahydropterin synthase-related protein [Terriglobales bacterium]
MTIAAEEHAPEAPLAQLLPLPAIIIAAVAFAALVPMFFLGNPSGHDFEFHLNSWMEIVSQWKQGILYPRWAVMAHYGYGEARFLFYPPASWMLGALLGLVLPWALVAPAFIWIALSASGLSMFFLARRWLSAYDAVFAAALYAVNPYHIVIVYWRSAFAELLASALLPLLLLFVLRAEQEGDKMIIPLSLVVAGAWLTNAPAAVVVSYSLALLVVVAAIVRRSPRILLHGVAAVVLGAALASFYLLPAAYEEKWVSISQVLSPGVRPQDNFLFTTLADPDHNRFNLLVSIVAVSEMVLLLGAAFLARQWRRQPQLWWTLATWAATAILLMFSIAFFFWEHLPKLRFVQLPWRWLLSLNVALVLFVTLGMRRWVTRLLLCIVMLTVIVLVWHRVQTPWWDSAEDIAEMRDNFEEGQGYEGTDEYVPVGADPYEIKQDARKVAVEGGGQVRIHVQQWSPEARFFTADVTQPARAVLRLFNYPAWRVELNGRVVPTETHEITGQMMLALPPGDNRVRITLARTWDRTLGGIISGVTAVCFIVVVATDKRRSNFMSSS